ncbi:MAG: DUF3305 domain-containing protein [Pseudomonadota bacterium]
MSDPITQKTAEMQVGVVIRRMPGVTRWAKWVWRPTAVLPGANAADWRELRREGEAVEFHAATLPVEIHRAETEAYRVALSDDPPSCWVILRPCEDPQSRHEVAVFGVTVSPFEAQDYADSGEEIVERVPMPAPMIAWLAEFVAQHHVDEPFIKRRRDKTRIDRVEDGKGDARVRQEADVYRAPGARRAKPEKLH